MSDPARKQADVGGVSELTNCAFAGQASSNEFAPQAAALIGLNG